jgi:hypothetical protein
VESKQRIRSKTLGVWIDAMLICIHLMRHQGNIHGMPLSAALGDDNLSCQNNRSPSETQQHWERHEKNIGYKGPKFWLKT